MAKPDLFSVSNPRARCFQVVLQFGPHSFTLLEYEKRSTAETALGTIRANWRMAMRERSSLERSR